MTTRPAGAPPMEMSKKTCGRVACCALIGVRLLVLESTRVAASRAPDGRLPRELLRLDASRAADGRDSWKVTAVQTLDLALLVTLGSAAATAAIAAERTAARRAMMLACSSDAESVHQKL